MFELVVLPEVEEYMTLLQPKQQDKMAAYFDRLVSEGYNLRRPIADNLGHGYGLWELRPGRHRILYFFHNRLLVIAAHAFLKKTEQIPQEEIETALKRKRAFEQGEYNEKG